MTHRRRRFLVVTMPAAYFVGVGFVGGVLAERVRFDRHRAEVLARFDSSTRAIRMQLMQLEQRSRADAGAPPGVTEER